MSRISKKIRKPDSPPHSPEKVSVSRTLILVMFLLVAIASSIAYFALFRKMPGQSMVVLDCSGNQVVPWPWERMKLRARKADVAWIVGPVKGRPDGNEAYIDDSDNATLRLRRIKIDQPDDEGMTVLEVPKDGQKNFHAFDLKILRFGGEAEWLAARLDQRYSSSLRIFDVKKTAGMPILVINNWHGWDPAHYQGELLCVISAKEVTVFRCIYSEGHVMPGIGLDRERLKADSTGKFVGGVRVPVKLPELVSVVESVRRSAGECGLFGGIRIDAVDTLITNLELPAVVPETGGSDWARQLLVDFTGEDHGKDQRAWKKALQKKRTFP